MNQEYLSITSEIKELEDILSHIPKENIIERMSFETRLSAVKEELAAIEMPPSATQKAKLIFRGKPVLGTYGIFADFASRASSAFIDAYASVVAGLNNNLRYMGPIPDKSSNDLLITGIARGSFGFEFELPKHQPGLFPEIDDETAGLAFEKMQSLFKLTVEGTDDDVADLVDEIHPRAVTKVTEFLDYLTRQNAFCGLEFNHKYFRYDNIEQIRTTIDRLKESNIKDATENYDGEFQGVLPKGRTFEFKMYDGNCIIRGKFDQLIEDPDIINREFLHKPAKVAFNVIQVGKSRPKFTLLDINDIQLSK